MSEKVMLELFSGSCQMSNTFKKHGWKTISIDYNPDYHPDIVMNVYDLTPDKIKCVCGGKMPNVIWLSPDCTTYSKLGSRFHREKITRTPIPKSQYAEYCDKNNRILFQMIKDLSSKFDILYFVENPRAFMRLMDFTENMPRYTVTYCQYGDHNRKETDIWTNHPNPRFKPCCKNGDKCHLPVGHNGIYGNGIQQIKNPFESAKIPIGLCEHIADICDEYFDDSNGFYLIEFKSN